MDSQPVLDVEVVRCRGCGQPIMSTEPYVVAAADIFHAPCFSASGVGDE